MGNEKVLRKLKTKRHILRIRNRPSNLIGHIMTKDRIKMLAFTASIIIKRSTRKDCVAYLTSFCKWMVEHSLA